MILEMPEQALKAAQEAIRAEKQLPREYATDRDFSYTTPARAYENAGKPDKARETLVRAMTSVLTRPEAELVRITLMALADLEQKDGREDKASALDNLAEEIERARRWVYRPDDITWVGERPADPEE